MKQQVTKREGNIWLFKVYHFGDQNLIFAESFSIQTETFVQYCFRTAFKGLIERGKLGQTHIFGVLFQFVLRCSK